jgi:hypothetical protein
MGFDLLISKENLGGGRNGPVSKTQPFARSFDRWQPGAPRVAGLSESAAITIDSHSKSALGKQHARERKAKKPSLPWLNL